MSALKFLLPGVITQEEFDAIRIEVQEVAPGILILVGLGGNIGVSYGEDETFMIDGQFGPLVEKILYPISKRAKKPVRYLLNTHWHLDHVAANECFARHGVTIMAHEKVRSRMSVDQPLPAFECTVPAAPKEALPVITFRENMSIHWNTDTIEIFHIPEAHTDGDVMVHFRKANVIHMGDIYFNGMYPLIDVDCGGSVIGMIEAVDAVLSRCDGKTKIIPGHGPLSGYHELKAYRAMLKEAAKTVADLIGQGKSEEEAIAAKPTVLLDAQWGNGVLAPDAFVSQVYASLVQSTRL
ncbi:MAG: MBL fold metallo-hydrolase [Bacteroidetes bacterium]|nr:MBL fold metallo-hydrolase [Bacteroidota bacterium]MCY4205103.1 MBL fold metallo-hydrolase [Bacteroidota bacterium]